MLWGDIATTGLFLIFVFFFVRRSSNISAYINLDTREKRICDSYHLSMCKVKIKTKWSYLIILFGIKSYFLIKHF